MAEIEGLRRLNRATQRVARALKRGAQVSQRNAASDIARDWRSDVPIDTREYQRSIDSDDESAFSTAGHAPFVEFGTSKDPAQPVGRRAAERARRNMPRQVARDLKARLP